MLKLSKKEIDVLKHLVEKLEEDRRHEQIRISQRRKAQIRGKTIARITQKKKKYTVRRRPAKRRSSIR